MRAKKLASAAATWNDGWRGWEAAESYGVSVGVGVAAAAAAVVISLQTTARLHFEVVVTKEETHLSWLATVVDAVAKVFAVAVAAAAPAAADVVEPLLLEAAVTLPAAVSPMYYYNYTSA